MTRSDLQLGFIGLGALGLPMAVNLQRASDRPLRVHTRSRSAEQNPALQGSRSCSNPSETAEGVDVLLLCVSDDQAVMDVLFGNDGAAMHLKPGSVVVDCSTIRPSTSRSAAEQLASRQVNYLDAPVTGGTEGARAGTLTVLVGGAAAVLDTVRPVLDVIGGSVHHFGAVGSGQKVKALNQILVAGSYAAVAEAMALGQRLDLPMDAVVNALQDGAAGSWALRHRAATMLDGHYPLGFRLSLHHKDLGIALQTAAEQGLNLPVCALVQQLEAELIDAGYGDEDVSCLRRWPDRDAAARGDGGDADRSEPQPNRHDIDVNT